jgi:antitoxin ParD1/3/4
MNVSLTPELEEFVNRKVESGMYSSASEVVRESLRLLREQDLLKQIRLEELRKEIALGLEASERGEVGPLDIKAIKAEGRKRLEAKRGK